MDKIDQLNNFIKIDYFESQADLNVEICFSYVRILRYQANGTIFAVHHTFELTRSIYIPIKRNCI